MVSNGLDLVLLLSVHYLRGRFREVDPMFFHFTIRCQQTSVEDVMDGPGRRELDVTGGGHNSKAGSA